VRGILRGNLVFWEYETGSHGGSRRAPTRDRWRSTCSLMIPRRAEPGRCQPASVSGTLGTARRRPARSAAHALGRCRRAHRRSARTAFMGRRRGRDRPKSRAGVRDIRILKPLLSHLAARRASCAWSDDPAALVLGASPRGAFGTSGLRDRSAKALADAGLKYATPRSTRRGTHSRPTSRPAGSASKI
jgi:hypothetical protein